MYIEQIDLENVRTFAQRQAARSSLHPEREFRSSRGRRLIRA